MSGLRGDGEERPSRSIEIIVSVATDHLAGIEGVASALTAAGLKDPEVLEAAGVITGRVPGEQALVAIRAIEGVEAVEPSRTIQLPPPDDTLQ